MSDGFLDLKGEEIACAVIIGGTLGLWITMLTTVYVCYEVSLNPSF
jgi:hypothetical protein